MRGWCRRLSPPMRFSKLLQESLQQFQKPHRWLEPPVPASHQPEWHSPQVFETADDNSSTASMKEENQDWNLNVADVMIGGSCRASVSKPAQLHRSGRFLCGLSQPLLYQFEAQFVSVSDTMKLNHWARFCHSPS